MCGQWYIIFNLPTSLPSTLHPRTATYPTSSHSTVSFPASFPSHLTFPHCGAVSFLPQNLYPPTFLCFHSKSITPTPNLTPLLHLQNHFIIAYPHSTYSMSVSPHHLIPSHSHTPHPIPLPHPYAIPGAHISQCLWSCKQVWSKFYCVE